MEHFEDNDDNDNDSDDVKDVSVHGSWITRRCPLRQQSFMRSVIVRANDAGLSA